jgi:hypothetical protein
MKLPMPFEIDPMKKLGEDKKIFKESTKKKIQLTFEHIVITTIPKQRKCCNKRGLPPLEPKIILNDVSGTI